MSTSFTMSKILPGLYVGNILDSRNKKLLNDHKISHILSVGDAVCPYFMDKFYMCIAAQDTPMHDMTQYFEAANDFIHCARATNCNVLVHCKAGKSRSVTLVAAYLMTITAMDAEEALMVIRSARPIANPNPGFMHQLMIYQGQRANAKRRLLQVGNHDKHQQDLQECDRILLELRNNSNYISGIDQCHATAGGISFLVNIDSNAQPPWSTEVHASSSDSMATLNANTEVASTSSSSSRSHWIFDARNAQCAANAVSAGNAESAENSASNVAGLDEDNMLQPFEIHVDPTYQVEKCFGEPNDKIELDECAIAFDSLVESVYEASKEVLNSEQQSNADNNN